MSIRSGALAVLTVLALLLAPTAAADPVEEPPPPTVVAVTPPSIVGALAVGETLTATPPTWSPTEATTTFQWLRDGTAIADAVLADYTPVAADVGAALAVVATGTLQGYLDGTTTSTATSPIGPGTLTAARPVISGTARVGSTLRVSPVSWNTDGVTTTYEWHRGGTVLSTGLTRKLATTDLDTRISMWVRGSKPGYTSVLLDSVPTAPVGRSLARVGVAGSSPRAESLRLQIEVTAPGRAVTGQVRVSEGSRVLADRITLRDGRATFTKTGVKPGRHRYTIRYAGTNTITSATGEVSVPIRAKVRPRIAVTSRTSIGRVSLGIAVTAPGQPPLGGTAYVKEGSKTLKATIRVVRGRASFSASGVKPGRHTYRVGYRGTSQVHAGSTTITVRVPAPPNLVSYPDCAAMRRVHPHGVGRSGATDSTSGRPVTNFLVYTKLYEYNDGRDDRPGERDLDRDNDGIACESH